MSEREIEVRVETQIYWRERSTSDAERMHRKQQNIRLQALAHKLNGPLQEIITELLNSND